MLEYTSHDGIVIQVGQNAKEIHVQEQPNMTGMGELKGKQKIT